MCWLVLVSFGRGKNTNAMYVFFNRWFVKHVVPDINASTIATSRNAKNAMIAPTPAGGKNFIFDLNLYLCIFFSAEHRAKL